MGAPEVFIIWLLLSLSVGGGIGYAIGSSKGRGVAGFWLGFWLGFIGWIIVGLMGNTIEEDIRRRRAVDAASQRTDAPTRPGGKRSFDDFISGANRIGPGGGHGTDPYASVRQAGMAENRTEEVDRLIENMRSRAGWRPPSAWMFSDGRYPLVMRQDGVVYWAASHEAGRIGLGVPFDYDASADGSPVVVRIDGIELRNPRPAASARRFVAEVGAQLCDVVSISGAPPWLAWTERDVRTVRIGACHDAPTPCWSDVTLRPYRYGSIVSAGAGRTRSRRPPNGTRARSSEHMYPLIVWPL